MAFTGTGNARLMAGGVSAATIPTMSGLVAALSGLYLATYLEQRANREVKQAEDKLVH
jgi:biopolymer transport protein ExbB